VNDAPWEEQKRTPARWASSCLALLQAVHPDYRRNREAKGRFLEFTRPLSCGLHVSQNFIRIRDEYHLCFGLLFSLAPTEFLDSPFVAGARFDHNRTIWRQFCEDLGQFWRNPELQDRPPPGAWSQGPWRRNTMERLETGFRVPETHLLPQYLDQLRSGSENLQRFFSRAEELLPALWDAHTAWQRRSPSPETLRLASAHSRLVEQSPDLLERVARRLEVAITCGVEPAAVMELHINKLPSAIDIARDRLSSYGPPGHEPALAELGVDVVLAAFYAYLPREIDAYRAAAGIAARLNERVED